jgi:peptide-methionine (S)-S-oxide reductase
MAAADTMGLELATFGAGCFWSTERSFRKQFGINLNSATVGYMSDISTADYEDEDTLKNNHTEVLQISFNPKNVGYRELVCFFFSMHNPTLLNRQRNNGGNQYRSIIFTHTDEQQKIAEQLRDEIQATGKMNEPVVTLIQPVNGQQFHIAEQKHQNYLENKYGWPMQS